MKWDGLGGAYSAVDERKKRGEMSVAVAVALATAMVKADSIGSNMFVRLGSIWRCSVSTQRVYLFHCFSSRSTGEHEASGDRRPK